MREKKNYIDCLMHDCSYKKKRLTEPHIMKIHSHKRFSFHILKKKTVKGYSNKFVVKIKNIERRRQLIK